MTFALGFQVDAPPGWLATEENDVDVDVAARARDELAWWQGQWRRSLSLDDRKLVDWARASAAEDLPRLLSDAGARPVATRTLALLRDFDAFEADANRAEPLGTQVGYVRLEAPTPPDGFFEVVRYRLARELTAIEFYKAAKPSPKAGWRGTRVGKQVKIDGLAAVRLYADFGVGKDPGEAWPKSIQHFLTDGRDGWSLECGCERNAFDDAREVLLAVGASFRRVKADVATREPAHAVSS